MQKTPQGFRIHIGFLGKRNVGKSSLINALTRQQISLVSDTPGTTTDPVNKAMELQPLGPVMLIDTAGLDDVGELGRQRIARTRKVLNRLDLAILVAVESEWDHYEDELAAELVRRKLPFVVVMNKSDQTNGGTASGSGLKDISAPVVRTSTTVQTGIDELRETLKRTVPPHLRHQNQIFGGLVEKGDVIVLVTPIDSEAPTGRMILPQVQAIRDTLDNDCWCVVAKETELEAVLNELKNPPALVVTDSQAFQEVNAVIPPDVALTSFSILFARMKGDLKEMAAGALAIDTLKAGDEVLIAEACCHHPNEEDIGRVKIPRWLQTVVGGELKFTWIQGHDFPEDLSRFRLIVHCGACTLNSREVLNRLHEAGGQNVPMTNYGLTIAHSLGILKRALEPFPEIC